MLLSAPTRSTGKRQPQQIASHLPLKLPGGRRRPSPARVLMPTPASAPLRSAALPSRTHHRAPPASIRRQWQLRQRPRRCPPRRTALVVPSPSVPLSTLNRKACSLLSCGRTAGCDLLSFLDAYSGYHQIFMAEEDEEKTAFITPCGT